MPLNKCQIISSHIILFIYALSYLFIYYFKVENFVGHATIKTTSVTGYQKNGMTIDGPGTTATVTGNTVTGAGRSATISSIIAQNGIMCYTF